MRIIFFGTPAFAAESLKALIHNNFNIVAVVTTPDKPAGRGLHLQQSAVKKVAENAGIQVLQPLKLKDPNFLAALKNLNADLQVVIAYRMLPEAVWQMPANGTINLHASLLPDYRGAAPINWAIINGETKTGLTIFFLKHQIDTGDMLLQVETDITAHMNAGELHDKLMLLGADLMVSAIKLIQTKNYKLIPQKETSLKTAPKIYTDTCLINWQQNAENIHNFIRGLSPYPTAFCFIDGKKVKIFSGIPITQNHQLKAGYYLTDGKTYLKIACNNGFIFIKELQAESKKRMPIEEFLKGFRPANV